MLTPALALCALLGSTGLYAPAVKPAYETRSAHAEIAGLAGRKLLIRVTWPKTDGPRPVIVWSHGMYGSRDAYDPLVWTWAAAGYVIIQPTHGDSISLMTAEQRRELLRSPNLDNIGSWQDRPREIGLVFDAFAKIESAIDGLEGMIDPKRAGIGGHSFGSHTAQMTAGMKVAGIGHPEARARAFLAISPSGVSPGVPAAALAAMRGPMMMITGTHDGGRKDQDAKWRLGAWEALAPGQKWLVWIEGAYHNFGGISGATADRMPAALRGMGSMGGPNAKRLALVQSATLAYWDATLKGDSAARKYLQDKALEDAGGVKVTPK